MSDTHEERSAVNQQLAALDAVLSMQREYMGRTFVYSHDIEHLKKKIKRTGALPVRTGRT